MNLSIVIVTWNCATIQDCLQAVFDSIVHFTFEVLVVDMDSKDGTANVVRRLFPQVEVVDWGEPRFCGVRNTLAFARARGRLVLLLNPDAVLHERTALASSELSGREIPHFAAAGCRRLIPDLTDPGWRCRLPSDNGNASRYRGCPGSYFARAHTFSGGNCELGTARRRLGMWGLLIRRSSSKRSEVSSTTGPPCMRRTWSGAVASATGDTELPTFPASKLCTSSTRPDPRRHVGSITSERCTRATALLPCGSWFDGP